MHASPSPEPVGPWDRVARELTALRLRAGNPSFEQVTRQVTAARIEAGASEHSARVARSTVYDCFRSGRARLNLVLVREIAAVLGAGDAEVDRWLAPQPEPAPASSVPVAPPTPSPAVPVVGPVPARIAVAVVAVGVLVGVLGREFQELLGLPIYLDMIGTAVSALALGPWWGALTGLLTNVSGIAVSGPASLPFALVNIAGALVWGYGVRRGWGRTLLRFLALNVAVAVVCSAIAIAILLGLYGGSTGHAQDTLVANFDRFLPLEAAVALGNLFVSVADKVISGFVALALVAAIAVRVEREESPAGGDG
ncbi:hypothetical protein GCM10027425_06300 [Alteromonas gracilis]